MKNIFKKKAVIIPLAILLVLVLAFGVLAMVYMIAPKGSESTDFWYSALDFDIADTVQIQKAADKDFIIVNFADLQMADVGDMFNQKYTYESIKHLIETYKPDLITLTGDQVWSPQTKFSLRKIISWIEEFDVLWAPVFGNHDSEGTCTYEYMCDLYEEAEHCVFQRGAYNLGYGNYIINIMEGESVYKTLYMFDTHRRIVLDEAGNTAKGLTDTQIDWYQWAVDGITDYNGGVTPESMCFSHVPLPEYEDAYAYWEQSGFDETIGFGYGRNEGYNADGSYDFGTSYSFNNGFFDVAKQNNTKYYFCGHDHRNNFSINYEGITLTYCLKTGNLAYYYYNEQTKVNQTGGTVITLSGANNVKIEHQQFQI